VKARINFVSKNSPSYVIEMDILEDGAIVERGYTFINSRALELLMRGLGVEKMRDLKGRTFETGEEQIHEKALKNFLEKQYPREEGLEIKSYFEVSDSNNDINVYKITAIFQNKNIRNFLIGREESYWSVHVSCYRKGFVYCPCCRAAVLLREDMFKLLMDHFEVSDYKDMIGEEFIVNVFEEPRLALFLLALKEGYPNLV
jgi:hypothetical protein